MRIYNYTTAAGKDVVQGYLKKLTPEEKVDCLDVIKRMADGDFERLRYKRWEKKVYEVYFKKHNRIFYVLVEADAVYIIHICKKQKNKTEHKDAAIVRKRAKELSVKFGKDFI